MGNTEIIPQLRAFTSDSFSYRPIRQKLSIVGLSISVVLIVYAYYISYPIQQTASDGVIYQVPMIFWLGIWLGLISLSGIALWSRRSIVSLPVIAGFYLLFTSRYHLYFYYGPGGDGPTIVSWAYQMNRLDFLPARGTEDYFTYLQWPIHHINTSIIQLFAETGAYATVKVGYTIYILMLAVGIFLFAYEYSPHRTPFYLYTAAVFYLLVTYNWLNEQFVPQFLALILIIFLFSIQEKSGARWLSLKVFLFIVLILSHPFLFIFYLIALTLLPAVKAIYYSIEESMDHQEDRMLLVIKNIPGKTTTIMNSLRTEFLSQYTSRDWIYTTSILITVYLTFLVYRFVTLPQTFIAYGLGFDPTYNTNILTVFGSILPSFVIDILPISPERGGTSGPEIAPLFEYVSTELYQFTLYGAMSIVLLTFAVLVISFILSKFRSVSTWILSMLLGTSLYLIIGTEIQIHSGRAFQIAFLPFIPFIVTLRNREKIVRAIIILLIISSPILLMNSMVNQSIAAGGNSDEFYSTQAAIHAEDHSSSNAIVPNRNGMPPTHLDTVVQLDEAVGKEYALQHNDIIISSPIITQYLKYNGYNCMVGGESTHSIYNNGNSIGHWMEENNNPLYCQ